MRLIKTGALLSCIFLLLITAGAGISFDAGWEQSITMPVNSDLHAQEVQKPGQDMKQDTEKRPGPEPSTALYQVMGVVLIIWIGLAFFLFRLDRRVAKLENQVTIKK